jgi:hypothetical protein
MPLLDLDRAPIQALRESLAQSQGTLDAARVDAALARKLLDAAQAKAGAADRIEALQAEVQRAQAALLQSQAARASLLQQIREASGRLLVGADPADMVSSLSGDIPVALLPLRLETRFVEGAPFGRQGLVLAVRAYPDTVHLQRHVKGLTAAEREGGLEYWALRAQGQGAEASVWRRLVQTYRAPRAQFIVQACDPAQPSEAQAVASLSRQTTALLLPDRLCAVGFAAGRREVFRVWGQNIPDELPMSPELDPTLTEADAAQQQLFGSDRQWMFRFDEALKVGMGLVVGQTEVNQRLAQRADAQAFALGAADTVLERLVVLGVDWTLDAQTAAQRFEELLQAHAAAEGLACLPLGTATNNTGRGASGLNSGELPAAPVDAAAAPAQGQRDAFDLLQHAFGLPGQALQAAQLPGASLHEQRTQMHMINALWRGSFGRYLDELWNVPIVDTEYVPDRAIDAVRDFAVGHLRPGGPLPLLRIGKQPYGALPVVANFEPADTAEEGVNKVLGLLRPIWRAALPKVPRVDGRKLEGMRELVQSGPWSVAAQFRNIENPNKSVKVTGISTQYGQVQANTKTPIVGSLLAAFGVQQQVHCVLETVVHDVQAHDLGHVPWVQADPTDPRKPRAAHETLDPPYIAGILADLGDSAAAKARLSARQDGGSLLEAMLAFSAEEEFDQGGRRLVDGVVAQSGLASVSKELKLSKHTPAFVGIAPPAAPPAFVEVNSSRVMANLKLPGLTGGDTLQVHVVKQLDAVALPVGSHSGAAVASMFHDWRFAVPAPLRNLSSIKASLAHLAPLKVGELDLAFRLTLDAFAYRLDAWHTALASKRLAEVRATRAAAQLSAGLHLGAYGVVEGLRRDTVPDSLGYTHAPSLGQAVAAAMLRSGFLANAGPGGEAFNIDLSSARVHKAQSMIEGIERGQSPSALLGYQFERALRDSRDFALAQYILDFRRRFPLRAAGGTASEEPAERVAARDVVDGLALLDGWAGSGKLGIRNLVDEEHRDALTQVLDALQETWDATSDVLVSESVYQLAQNNLERSAAAAAVLDAHGPGITPQVTRTPRASVSYAQRLVGLCEGTGLPPAWQAAAATDPMSAAEPRVDAWLAAMLGEAARFQFSGQWLRGADVQTQQLSPTQLRRGPLALVLGSMPNPSGKEGTEGTALRSWLVQAFEAQAPAGAGWSLQIPERNDDGSPGFAEFEALAQSLRELVAGARALTRHDLVVPQDELEAVDPPVGEYAGVDAAELGQRATVALQALNARRAALLAAGGDGDLIAQQMQAAWPFGLREALSPPRGLSAPELTRWMTEQPARRDHVVAEIDERLVAIAALPPRGRTPVEPRDPMPAEAIGIAIDTVKIVFGKHFPVLPVFRLGAYAAAVQASRAQRADLLVGDDTQLAGWLPKLARVREGADRLDAALTAHEALHESAAPLQRLDLWQLPHRPGQAWAALPQAWTKSGRERRQSLPQLAVVAQGIDPAQVWDGQTALAGFAIDEWQETVPEPVQTTGVAFHYDAPGARPPQALLLAVPPRMGMENWTFNALLASVHEAVDLAQIRCVRPKDLGAGLGAVLPGNFLPQHDGPELPSVELWRMAHKYAAFAGSSVPLGKI